MTTASVEEKLKKMGLCLPQAAQPLGSYRPVMIAGGMAFLSGQLSKTAEGRIIEGKMGKDLTLEEGAEAARIAALNVISIARDCVGLDRFQSLIRVVGYIQTTPEFYDLPKVLNGASDLFIELFGDNGVHARSAVGMSSLPLNAAVELEVTLLLRK